MPLQLGIADETWSSRAQVQTLKEQDWERTQQASMLADVAQVFESDEGMSDDAEGPGCVKHPEEPSAKKAQNRAPHLQGDW